MKLSFEVILFETGYSFLLTVSATAVILRNGYTCKDTHFYPCTTIHDYVRWQRERASRRVIITCI